MNDTYEIINGKKYKKCGKNQVRNPVTMRCNKVKVAKINKKQLFPVVDKVPNVNIKSRNSQIKNKNSLSPFTNRVTANIYDRIVYYKKIIKHLKFDKNRKNYCIRFYKFDKKTEKPIFRIGNNIILKTQISRDSLHGAIFLSSFRDETSKLFKYIIKVTPVNPKTTVEIKINEIVSNAVLKKLCPHFPISYGNALCMKDNLIKSSFISSEGIKSYKKEDIPNFVFNNKGCYSKYDNPHCDKYSNDYYIYLNELASGDLQKFNNNIIKDNKLVNNTIAQLFISLMFFYKETGCYHCNATTNNFLYHTIKKGGYFHYRIFKQDYYIENIGYLWIIWNYREARSLKELKSNNSGLYMGFDFTNILFYLYHTPDYKIMSNRISLKMNEMPFNQVYNKKLFQSYIISILDCLCDLGCIYKSITSNEIINKKPYIIDDISPMEIK